MDNIRVQFGKRLKYIRKSKRYTQEQLAEAVEINLRQLARIEAGESFITAETLQKICTSLQIEPEFLFRFTMTESPQNDFFRELIQKIETISNDEKKLEFINIAYEALNKAEALEKLKLMIKGLELKH